MGFGDYLIRMQLMYNFIKTFTDMKFKNLPYKNPHSTNVNFFSLVEVSEDEQTSESLNEIILEMEDYLFILLIRRGFFEPETLYRIGMGPGRVSLIEFSSKVKYPDIFIAERCRYANTILSENPFDKCSDLKIVYHLRRT